MFWQTVACVVRKVEMKSRTVKKK